MTPHAILWIIFIFLAVILFIFDLRLSVLKPHSISFKESISLCLLWIFVASLYGAIVGHFLDTNKMIEYFTAYVVEYSLSIDNMFVFLMIFTYFNIEKKYQPKVLVIGVLSAVVMRLIFIFAGIALINKFEWIIYIFAAILVYTGIKMVVSGDEQMDPGNNIALKFISKKIGIDMKEKTGNFFIRRDNKLIPSVMIAVLIVIESSDLIFAVDSIPAVLGISTDRLVVYSSNIFAVIGLRSLYFALASLNDYFKYLKIGVAIILVFVGLKMFLSHFIIISPITSLCAILLILAASMLASIIKR
jgi:tellurite resistance protein TerC